MSRYGMLPGTSRSMRFRQSTRAWTHLVGRVFSTLIDYCGRDPNLAPIPIIIVTGDRRADVGNAAAVLRKPLDLDELAAAILTALDHEGA